MDMKVRLIANTDPATFVKDIQQLLRGTQMLNISIRYQTVVTPPREQVLYSALITWEE